MKASLINVLELKVMSSRFHPIFFNKLLLQQKTLKTKHLTEIFCSTLKKITFTSKWDFWQSTVQEWPLKQEAQSLIGSQRTQSKF